MTDLSFAFAAHKNIPGAGVIACASGVALDRQMAKAMLLGLDKQLFRAGVPTRPWPEFLPPMEQVRAEREQLRAAVAEMEAHRAKAMREQLGLDQGAIA